jgi:hypothetical protein
MALPMDWNGAFGVDFNTVINVRKTDDACTPSATTTHNCTEKESTHARFQTYVLRLNPSIIINDSATFKGEISTGSSRGNFLGSDTNEGDAGNSSPYSTNPNGGSTLNINQAYVELYADSGLYRIGKFSRHFGMGAVLSSGQNTWDRFFTQYDGVEAEFRLGKTTVIPAWTRIATDVATVADTNANPSGRSSVIERSLTAKYEDLNSEFLFGLYYGVRESETSNELYGTTNAAGAGASNISIVDVFLDKRWGDIKLAFEAALVSGDIGDVGKQDKPQQRFQPKLILWI